MNVTLTDAVAAGGVWADSMLALHVAGRLSCVEAESLATILRFLGEDDAADMWVGVHGEEGDDDCDDEHHGMWLAAHELTPAGHGCGPCEECGAERGEGCRADCTAAVSAAVAVEDAVVDAAAGSDVEERRARWLAGESVRVLAQRLREALDGGKGELADDPGGWPVYVTFPGDPINSLDDAARDDVARATVAALLAGPDWKRI